jgi:tetratricopeptide (TPR) repeat protein
VTGLTPVHSRLMYIRWPMPVPKRATRCTCTLALAVGFSALAAGGVHLWVLTGYAALVVISGLLALPLGQPGGSRDVVGASVWFALASFCLLQALPLPRAWLEALAPNNADIWARSLSPFGLPPPALASISLAPQRTIVEALKFASYGVVFGVSARLARQCGVSWLARLVFASALAVALVTAAHQLVGAERLFGVYRPLDVSSVAPLLNPNNRAGYLNLGFFCGLGLLFRAGAKGQGAFIGLGLVCLVAASLLCQSRGGTGCLMLGMVLLLLLRRKDGVTRGPELGRRWQAAIVVLIATSGTLMVLTARPKGGLGLEDQSLEKLDSIGRVSQLVLDHFGLGIGRGAFGTVFSSYQSSGSARVDEYGENFPLQWAAEWGVPITLAAFAALAWALWPALSRRSLQSPVRRCALVGCLVLMGQNLVDLGLEVPALGAAFACVLGALSGGARSSRGEPPEMSPRLLGAGSLLTLGCLALALVYAQGSDSPALERNRLHAELVAAHGAPPAGFWLDLRRAVEAYPADAYFPLLGANAALASRQDALPWVARALERSPSSAAAHITLAEALQARGVTGQALGALRRAAELDPSQAPAATQLALRWDRSATREVVPEGPGGASVLRALADTAPDPVQRLHWLEQSLERNPNDPEAHYQLALGLFRDLTRKEGAVACRERQAWCLSAVQTHAREAERPGSSRAAILEAQLLEWQSGPAPAEAELSDACRQLPADLACAQSLATLAIKTRSPHLPGAVNALVALACGTREGCGQIHMRLGQQFAGQGQWHSAASHFWQATQEAPSPESWRAVGQAYRQLGQEVRAASALRRAEQLDSKPE